MGTRLCGRGGFAPFLVLISPEGPEAAGVGGGAPPIAAGQPGGAEPLNRTVQSPRVFFDTYQAEVLYSGLAPGIAGRYQVTVRVPALVSPATNISVSLTIGGFASNRVTIPVR